MNIKKGTVEDIAHLRRLNHELFLFEDAFDKELNLDWPSSKEGTEEYTKELSDEDKCVFFAVDEKPVGYLAGAIQTINWRKGKIAEVEHMFIEEAYRKKGVGSELMQAFFDWCKEKKVTRVKVLATIKNEDGVSFYEKNGYEQCAVILERDV